MARFISQAHEDQQDRLGERFSIRGVRLSDDMSHDAILQILPRIVKGSPSCCPLATADLLEWS